MAVIKRRVPSTVGPPKSTAGPNRWIPKIRIIVGRGILPLAAVIAIRGPHQLQPPTSPRRPILIRTVQTNYKATGNVIRIKPPLNSLPRIKGYKGRVVLTDYKRPGIVLRTYPKKAPQVNRRVRNIRTVLTSYRRPGKVVRIGPLAVGTGSAWNNIQDQIDSGYGLYAEPAELTGSYVEVFDFGSVIDNIVISINWNRIDVVGTVGATVSLETSIDAITWTAPTIGSSAFAPTLRYVRMTINFTGADKTSLAYLYNIRCLLNVAREQDGGVIAAVSTDVGGTVVTFNKTFKSIDSIALAPISTVQRTAIYDFAFPVNPTTFKILLYDAAGARVSGNVSWIARGIV